LCDVILHILTIVCFPSTEIFTFPHQLSRWP